MSWPAALDALARHPLATAALLLAMLGAGIVWWIWEDTLGDAARRRR